MATGSNSCSPCPPHISSIISSSRQALYNYRLALRQRHHNISPKMICSAVSPFHKYTQSLKKHDLISITTENACFGLSPCDPFRRSRQSGRRNNISSKVRTASIEIAMNGGEGQYSYAENSTYQRGYIEAAKEVLKQEIIEKLDVAQTEMPFFRITDLGCSTGPNTYMAVDTLVEAVELKFKSQGPDAPLPEIEVIFNDSAVNDFKTLFHGLPPDRRYYATAAPGSFYGRLFPKASIHIAYSSCTLCWLSKIPEEVTSETSPAWNKGSIHYYNRARKEVFQAYEAQFAVDTETFLQMRAEEIVAGGLMALLVIAVPDTMSDGGTTLGTEFELLGHCLVDMAEQGTISEEILDTFNLPLYYTRPTELKDLINQNGSFSIERMEILDNKKEHVTMPNVNQRTLFLRACFQGVLGQHFGYDVVDEIFERYEEKVPVSSFYLQPENHQTLMLFVLLKRTIDK